MNNINSLLNNIDNVTEKLKNTYVTDNVELESPQKSFGAALKEELHNVNNIMNESSDLKEKFSKGDPNITLPTVMMQSEKSNLYFNLTLEMRNKVISAYNDIMNMSV